MSKQILAIDPGTYSIKAAIVNCNLRGAKITGLYEFPRRRRWEEVSPISIEEEMREFISLIPSRGKRCILSLPSDSVIYRNISLPFTGKHGIEEAAKYAIEEEIPFDVETLIVNCLLRHHMRSKETDLIIVGAEKGIISERISIFSGLGIELEEISIDALGLSNLGRTMITAPNRTFAVADIGARKTVVVIMKGGYIQMVRAISIGGDHITEAISRHLKVSFDDAELMKKVPPGSTTIKGSMGFESCIEEMVGSLAREMELFFSAYQIQLKGEPIEAIYLSGGTSSLNGIDGRLNKNLSIDCMVVNPLEHYPNSLSEVNIENMPQMATAIGLAMESAKKTRAQRANFRKGEFRPEPRFWERKKSLVISSMAILLITLTYLSDFFVHLYVKERKFEALKVEMRTLFKEAFPDVKNIVDEEIQMKRLIEEERSKGIQALVGVNSSSRVIDILREISLRIPSSMRMIFTDLEIDQEGIHIAGETDSFETIDRLKEMLGQSSIFKDFQLLGAKQNPKTKAIEFRLRMGRKEL